MERIVGARPSNFIFIFFLSIVLCQKKTIAYKFKCITYILIIIYEKILFLSQFPFDYCQISYFVMAQEQYFQMIVHGIFASRFVSYSMRIIFVGVKMLRDAKYNKVCIGFYLYYAFKKMKRKSERWFLLFLSCFTDEKEILLQNPNQNVINSNQGQRIGIRTHSKCSLSR